MTRCRVPSEPELLVGAAVVDGAPVLPSWFRERLRNLSPASPVQAALTARRLTLRVRARRRETNVCAVIGSHFRVACHSCSDLPSCLPQGLPHGLLVHTRIRGGRLRLRFNVLCVTTLAASHQSASSKSVSVSLGAGTCVACINLRSFIVVLGRVYGQTLADLLLCVLRS